MKKTHRERERESTLKSVRRNDSCYMINCEREHAAWLRFMCLNGATTARATQRTTASQITQSEKNWGECCCTVAVVVVVHF